jgi:hypothetical protein
VSKYDMKGASLVPICDMKGVSLVSTCDIKGVSLVPICAHMTFLYPCLFYNTAHMALCGSCTPHTATCALCVWFSYMVLCVCGSATWCCVCVVQLHGAVCVWFSYMVLCVCVLVW